jgi:hypothetical protein
MSEFAGWHEIYERKGLVFWLKQKLVSFLCDVMTPRYARNTPPPNKKTSSTGLFVWWG